jgi:hypothetical protein
MKINIIGKNLKTYVQKPLVIGIGAGIGGGLLSCLMFRPVMAAGQFGQMALCPILFGEQNYIKGNSQKYSISSNQLGLIATESWLLGLLSGLGAFAVSLRFSKRV